METYCTILLHQATKSDVLSACIQADASIRAGMEQAAAATRAGWLTFGAGVFALVAAFATGWCTLRAVMRQRIHELKSVVYLDAVKTLAEGFIVVSRMANLADPDSGSLASYNNKLGNILGVHLVADIPTGAALLLSVEALGAMHKTLLATRPPVLAGGHPSEERIAWARTSTDAITILMPSITKTIVAMRKELGLPIELQEYEAVVLASMTRVIADNERFYTLVRQRQG